MRKLFNLIFVVILFIPFVVKAEELKLDWQKSWGGNNGDEFYDIIQTQDGGFIVAGDSMSTDIEGLPNKGKNDVIIVKYDKDGNVLWQKNWGGNSYDDFYDILQTQDGGFMVAGDSSSTDIEGLPNKGGTDVIILKYDKDGNLLWQKNWGGNKGEALYDILQTQDGGFIVFGDSWSTDIEGLPNKGSNDVIIVKYDKDGNLLWQKSWGGSDADDSLDGMIPTQDGGYILYGYSSSTDIEGLPNKGGKDAIIVKYDKDGNLLWQKSWGGNRDETFSKILKTPDGGFIVVGSSNSTDIEGLPNKGSSDAIIVKYDKDGNMLWQKNWGGNDSEDFKQMIQTQDGGFIVVGSSLSTDIEGLPNKGSIDAIIVKYDKDGNILWQNSWGGSGNDVFKNILETFDYGFLTYGYSFSEDIQDLPNKDYADSTIIVKYDKDGNLLWQKSGGGDDDEGEFKYIFETTDGGFTAYLDSRVTNSEGLISYDAIIVKYDKDGNLLWQNTWGGNSFEEFYGMIPTQDGGFIVNGWSLSTDIDGLPNKGYSDAIIVKYSISHQLENITSENGTSNIEQQGSKGIITPTPNEGYEVDTIIIKDKNGKVLDLEVTKLEDGTYSFDLYTDVSVEVLFKEKIENPKTGLFNYIGLLFSMLVCSLISFWFIMRKDKRFEL